jgi:hypothetical protein
MINSTNYLTPSSSLFPILVFTIFIVPFENSDIENHSYFFYVFKTKDQILIHKKKGKNQINEDHIQHENKRSKGGGVHETDRDHVGWHEPCSLFEEEASLAKTLYSHLHL